jgi:hypothetical protein
MKSHTLIEVRQVGGVTADRLFAGQIAWGDFARDNPDLENLAKVQEMLEAGQTVMVGGGAAPLFELARVGG